MVDLTEVEKAFIAQVFDQLSFKVGQSSGMVMAEDIVKKLNIKKPEVTPEVKPEVTPEAKPEVKPKI